MPQAVESTASVEQLEERLRQLERRVSLLEGQHGITAELEKSGNVQPRIIASAGPTTGISQKISPSLMSGGLVPILGKAVIGIAGAYLLRAVAESKTIPHGLVLSIAIAYAASWMVWAAKTYASSRFASTTYAITSVLIFCPLVWESTVRFQVLQPPVTATVLVGFALLALALAFRRDLQIIPWVAVLATIFTAWALIIATHELVILTIALLAVVLANEIAACVREQVALRIIPAIATDFAMWLLLDVMTSAQGVPEGYRGASPAIIALLCVALIMIYAGSIGIRSFGLHRRLRIFEIVQLAVVFSVGSFGMLRAGQAHAALALGVMFIFVSAVCYWGALSRFGDLELTGNRRVCAICAGGFLIAAVMFLLPVDMRSPFLCMAAVAAVFVYVVTGKISLGVHASLFLAVATGVSSLPIYVENALTGILPLAPHWDAWIVTSSAALCYFIGSRRKENQITRRLLWLLPAIIVASTGASLAVVAITSHMELSAPRLSVIRTLVNCAVALTFAFFGSRCKRVELGWVAYTAVAFGTIKLLFEDMRFGNAASLVISFLSYGAILIVLPRFTSRVQS